MLFYLTLGFSGVFMLLEVLKINKYMSRFLAIVPLVFLFIIIAFNRMSRDYTAYAYAFWDINFRDSLEFGYSKLVDIVEYFGGNHDTIVFLVGVFFIFTLCRLLESTAYVNLVVFFYCAYPLIYDITQTRNYIMCLITILSLFYVIKDKPIRHYLVLFAASLFHSFAFIFAPFYFLCKLNRKKFISIMLWITVILIIGSPIVINMLGLIFPGKMVSYLRRTPGMGVYLNYFYVAMDILTVWWVDKRISKKINEKDSRKMEVFYRFVWFPILIIPFSHYFLEIVRMERNVLLVKYIYVALAMKYLSIRQRLMAIAILAISAISYFVIINSTGQWDLIDYLDDNSFKYFFENYSFF